jgi:hypothetical protein
MASLTNPIEIQDWRPDKSYAKGEVVRFLNKLYRCVASPSNGSNVGVMPIHRIQINVGGYVVDTQYLIDQLQSAFRDATPDQIGSSRCWKLVN